MNAPAPSPTAESILNTGLLNQWYLVCRSSDVGADPVSLVRLGQHIALWRDKSGAVHAVEDVCPHRLAPLSAGVVQDEGLACRYHGLVVNGKGVVVSFPAVSFCRYVNKKMISGYPVREAAGAIFLYFSDGTDDSVPQLQLPEQLTSPDWSGFIYAEEWNCHYRYPLDNRMDPVHAVYLHSDSTTLAFGVKQSKIELHETPTGFYIERDNQKGVNIDRTELVYRPGHNFWIFTSIPYPKAAGGNFFTIISHITPIDEKRTYVWFMRYQQSSGWRRDLWRFLYRNRLEQRHAEVVAQDRAIMEAIERNMGSHQKREALIQCDVGVARVRRLYAAAAEEQAKRMAARANRLHTQSDAADA